MNSCCLIGEDSLLIQCGDILLSHHFWIERVVSPTKTIQEWAEKNNIVWVSSIGELLSSSFYPVEYVFSIVNSFILPASVLNMAKQATINYHDSLLPRYAGLNATTWALINKEKEHGITWHMVNEGIDEGDIVKQVRFPILNEDTAFSLNLRCYEHAIQAFSDLVSDILNGTLLLTKQDLRQRSYFGLTAMIPNLGFIDWNKNSAESIVQLCRATALGHYNNNVGCVKLYLHQDYLIISQALVISCDVSSYTSGTLIDIKEDGLVIATSTNALKVTQVFLKTGELISIESLKKTYNLHIGIQFESIHNEPIYFKTLHAKAVKNEPYWIQQFVKLNEHETFTPASLKKNNTGLELAPSSIRLPPPLIHTDEDTKKEMILTTLLIYLYRLNDYGKTSVSLVYSGHHELNNPCGSLFSAFLPLILGWNEEMTLEDLVIDVKTRLKEHEKAQTFFTDIVARHPILENKHLTSNIIINLMDESEHLVLPQDTLLYFHYSTLFHEVKIAHCIDEHYHSGLLQETLNNMAPHMEHILDHLITKPHLQVSEFCFLTENERYTLLNVWGKGEVHPIPQKSIIELFEYYVHTTPQAPALVTNEQIVTYNELSHQVDKIAYYIQKQNIPPQTLIGLYSPRTTEMLVVLLGILKAQCIYVPLDTRYPLLKIETIANEAQLNHVITTTALKAKLAPYFSEKQIVQCHDLESILVNSIPQNHFFLAKDILQSLAYIMFTSGTTGTPKGVVVSQKNVLNYCTWFTKTTAFSSSSIIDFSSSIAFDLSVPCTIAPLVVGGCIALCDEATKTNPKRYLHHLIDHQVTHTELTPGYIEMLLHYPNLVKKLTDLKFLMLGADVVHTQEVKNWLELCPHHQIVNEYGPTETTVSVTSYFVSHNEFMAEAAAPIGRPAFNSTAYLLDKRKNLCPIGMKGELFIGGAQVTDGYLGKPELTEAKFIPLSLNNHRETLYRTGDLAAWLPKGFIQFFGRNDFQVKIQGYRIELPAIESALLHMDEVEQAVVLVHKGHFKEKYLRAYLVLKNDSLSIKEIRTFLSTYLPNYMIPKEFCITHSIPLKENEKIDINALEQQAFIPFGLEHEVDEHLTESEKIMMTIWHGAFNATDIHHHDDFFALGGDSLLALHIINALKQHYHIDIPLFYIFEYPTIALLSKQIDHRLTQISSENLSKGIENKWIIPLATGTHKTPLVLVHPVGGTVFWYKQLANHLAGKYTVYGIQDASVDGDERRFHSIEEMARFYIEALSEVYQGEEFALAGASFGATVAFEMAKQLLSSHKIIHYLGFFDGWTQYPESLMRKNTISLLVYKEGNGTDELAQLEKYRKNLLLNYTFSSIKTNAVLYKAKELWNDFIDVNQNDNGWSSTINGHLSTHLVEGNHETMLFQENGKSLAEQIHLDLSTGMNVS
ncbi:MAG: amino acid adenylation domain-containing protein [Legionella sp.]|uniref:amino acid adenylation domain-containing protein n=1 Tax=Legionella sp. TaxID=459 RepID=UPI0039E48008